MTYDRLAARLRDSHDAPSFTLLPDGSVDRFRRVVAGDEPIRKRESFGRELVAGDRNAFGLRTQATEPGGQAVNAAQQCHALGGRVTLYGHLDNPVFEELPFEAVSMGRPAEIDLLEFDDGEVMLVGDSPDISTWSLDDLRAAAPDAEAALSADAVCWMNWTSFPNATAAMREVAEATVDGEALLCDPGGLVGRTPDELASLRDALGALDRAYRVTLSAAPAEIRAFATALDLPAEDDEARVEALHEVTGVTVVLHGPRRALAASDDGTVSVDTVYVDEPERTSGGGDRFTAGLAYAEALGWDRDLALACGNACASYFVGQEETASAADLVRFLEDRASEI